MGNMSTRSSDCVIDIISTVINGIHNARSHSLYYNDAILAILIHHTTSTLSDSTSTISRSLELSLQSSLQLSFTVLVCYRIRVRIQPQMKFITHLRLHFQATRLHGIIIRYVQLSAQVSHPLWNVAPIKETLDMLNKPTIIPIRYISLRHQHRKIQRWAFPSSLAVTLGILVSFFSSAK